MSGPPRRARDVTKATGMECRIPASTYRVQLHAGFTFADLRGVLPYLARLGVTDCYLSPCLQARPGSQHGYDICDHTRLNPELGDEADYDALVAALAERGMGQILDFVANHMGIDPRTNPWWRDVLENGRSSSYAHFFDIDWEPIKPELKGKPFSVRRKYTKSLRKNASLRLDLESWKGQPLTEARVWQRRCPKTPGWRDSENLVGRSEAERPEAKTILVAVRHIPRV